MGKYTEFLAETDLFFNLTKTQLEMIDSISEELVFQRGEIIFAENSHQTELYLILEGIVEILINPAMVAPQHEMIAPSNVIATLRRGQCFGEIALVDGGLRSATARASRNNTRLIKIASNRLMQQCTIYPELGFLVMRNLAVALGQKIRLSNLRAREEILYRIHTQETASHKG